MILIFPKLSVILQILIKCTWDTPKVSRKVHIFVFYSYLIESGVEGEAEANGSKIRHWGGSGSNQID